MSTSEIKIYTTFDSFDADQVIATLEYYDIPSVKQGGRYFDRDGVSAGDAGGRAGSGREELRMPGASRSLKRRVEMW